MASILRVSLFSVLMLLSASTMAAPCAGFTDVDTSNPACQDIEWVKNRLITTGCGGTSYCPGEAVIREHMALFLARLGRALTPERLFVDANPGPVAIQGSSGFVCQSAAYVPLWNQTAVIHGLVWGLVTAPVTWTADIWYSVNGGSYNFITNFIPQNVATAAGMTQGTTFAYLALSPGSSYTFAILLRESPDVTTGTGNFSDAACHLMAEFGNRTSLSSPYDAGRQPAPAGLLGSNREP